MTMKHLGLIGLVCATGLSCAAPARAAPAGGGLASTPAPDARLQAEVRSLEDGDAIKKLQRAYGYYIDRGYWTEAANLFADDASFESGIDGVYVGRRRILEYLIRKGGGNAGPGLPFGQYNHHMQLQPVIDVAPDGRTAAGRWRELALTGQFKVSAYWEAGIYENSYVKQDGVWKIAALHHYPQFTAPYEGGWAKLAAAPADWRSQVARDFAADRPPTVRYRPFPERFAVPFHRAASARATSGDAQGADALRIAILRSRREIENLQATYGFHVDAGQWSAAAALFAANGTYEDGQGGVYVGPGHIRAALGLTGPEGLAPGQLNIYVTEQPIIDVAPDNKTAKGRWRSDVLLSREGKGQWGEGEYENDYVNDGGVWKIQALHFYRTVFADYDKGWGAAPIAMSGPNRDLPPDRPPTEIYASFPSPHLTPFHYSNPVTTARPAAAPAAGDTRALDPLMLRVTRLEDHDAIEKIQRAYGYYVDKNLWPEVAGLFADGGSVEIGGRGVFVTKPHIQAYLETLGPTGPAQDFLMNHQQFQGIVDVAPDGLTAAGRWTAFVMAGKMPKADWGDVTYENRYVKDHGVWKIEALHAAFIMYTPYADGWGKTGSPITRPDSWPPPPDFPPTVLTNNYPNFYVEPFHYPNPVTGAAMLPPDPAAGGIAPMGGALPDHLKN
ncbi:hypothetical protein BH09PSE4_BH09PSE4_21110 [soil metagenome]